MYSGMVAGEGRGSLYIYQTSTGSNVKLASSWSTRKHTLRHVTILIKTSSHIISMGATSYQKTSPKKLTCVQQSSFSPFQSPVCEYINHRGRAQVCLFLYPIPEMSLLIVLSKGKADVLCLLVPLLVIISNPLQRSPKDVGVGANAPLLW